MATLSALVAALLLAFAPAGARAAEGDEAGFAIRFREDVIAHRVFGVYVMPGETATIAPVLARERGGVALEAGGGRIERAGDEAWRWTAPSAPGHVKLRLRETRSGDEIILNAFVKTPFDHRGTRLDGYRIGRYRAEPLRSEPAYERPRGFVKVTPDNRDLRVSPNFTLGQFRCKQNDGPPDYLALRERLLLKLEMILDGVRDLGVDAESLHVMSGFRTPYYNRAIGNTTDYSRHLYGGAADIFVDTDGDGTMDDLDGNGAVDKDDAEVLADIVRGMADETRYRPFAGGLGVYGAAPHRGPFVHVDVRGYRARW